MTERDHPSAGRGADHATGETRPILLVPHAALRAKARRVTEADRDAIAALVPAMFGSMYAAPGIGLAAPQLGVGLRLVVTDLGDEAAPAPMVLVNPEIVRASETRAIREEGCLSIPGLYADVERPDAVVVRYADADGRVRTVEADGLLAACLQHEIDHLDGVLFVDHLSALKRNMLLRRFAKEQRTAASGGPARPRARA